MTPFAPSHHPSRPLDGLEKAFWLLDQNLPTHFCVIAEVTGATSAQQWSEAFDAVGRTSALLGSQIVPDAEGHPLLRFGPTRSIPSRFVIGEHDRWTVHVEAELATRFDTTNEAPVRARVLHATTRSIVILTAHHSFADGNSLVSLLRDIVAVVGGEKIDRIDDTQSIEAKAFPHVFSSVPSPPETERSDVAPPSFRFADEQTPTVTARRFTSAETKALRALAHDHGSTIHGMICAAAAERYMQSAPITAVRPLRVFSPVDARRRLLQGAENLGAYVSGIRTASTGIDGSFWESARHFSRQSASLNDADRLVRALLAVRTAMTDVSTVQEAAAVWAATFGAEILVTNLSAFPLPSSFGTLRIEHLWGPAVAPGIESEQSIGLVTVGGQMHLTHTSAQPIEGFLATLMERLTALTDAG